MSEIQTIETILTQIQFEIAVNEQGEGFISRKGLARLLGVSKSTFMQGGARLAPELAEILARRGLDVGALFEGTLSIPDAAVGPIARYFAFNSKSPSTQAALVVDALLAASVRELFRSVKGWQPVSQKNYSAEVYSIAEQIYQAVSYQTLIADQPGEQHVWDNAATDKTLPGNIFLLEWLEQQPVKLTQRGRIRLGQMAAEQYRKAYQKAVPKATYKALGFKPIYPASFQSQLMICLQRVQTEPNTVKLT